MKKTSKKAASYLPDEPIGRIYSSTELKKIGKENSAALQKLKKKKVTEVLSKIKTS